MRRTKAIYYLAVSILYFVAGVKTAWAQVNISDSEARLLTEKTLLITDRETYCANEEILFSAMNISEHKLHNYAWSNVLYVQLLTPDGEVIVQTKFDYNETASGALPIPKWTLTGNYYLRAYTRWMRNFPVETHFFKMVRIINPFRDELLEPRSENVVSEGMLIGTQPEITGISVQMDRKQLKKRQQLEVKLQLDNWEDYRDELVVSVIRKGTEKPLNPKLSGTSQWLFSNDFIAETRGVSMSGQVINEPDSLPLPYTLVGLTIFKENPENLNMLTDENGRFYFDLSKLTGTYELFISAKAKQEAHQPLILVDNDFSSGELDLPFVTMNLSESTRPLYESLSFTSQLQDLYRDQVQVSTAEAIPLNAAFYGDPDFSLNLDEYITLPSVSEYIHELIPRVRVKNEQGKRKLAVVGLHPELDIYAPLVMIDMVSVFDVEPVLELDPEKLERIEVVVNPYVRGNITYGGIISFFSRKGDLAGIDLPSVGRFISYSMLSEDQGKTPTTQLPVSRIPDLRNCIYWNSSLQLDDSGFARLEFNTGDNTGEYLIVVRAVNEKGEVQVKTVEIRID